jgi:hypothetical protein
MPIPALFSLINSKISCLGWSETRLYYVQQHNKGVHWWFFCYCYGAQNLVTTIAPLLLYAAANSAVEKTLIHLILAPIKASKGVTSSACSVKATALQMLVVQKAFSNSNQTSKLKDLCIFLPKFHCELSHIEFFWGWLRENCDYTFPGLQEN